jgi:hypothetical protein
MHERTGTLLRAAAATLMVTASVVLWPLATSADTGQAQLVGPSVRYFNPPQLAELSNTATAIITGTPLAGGGCQFTSSIRSDAPYNTEIEIARDDTTCTSLVVRGTAPLPLPRELSYGTPSSTLLGVDTQTDEQVPCPPFQCASLADIYQTYTHGAEQWFSDPQSFLAADDSTSITWTEDRSINLGPHCVLGDPTSQGTAYNEATYTNHWQQYLGWDYASNSWSETSRCPTLNSQTTTSYSNRGFCSSEVAALGVPVVGALVGLFAPTDLSLTTGVTSVDGGTATYTTTWSDSGPCSNLLSHGMQLT